jgi:hypothetical protein
MFCVVKYQFPVCTYQEALPGWVALANWQECFEFADLFVQFSSIYSMNTLPNGGVSQRPFQCKS